MPMPRPMKFARGYNITKESSYQYLNYFGKRNQVGDESDDLTEPEDEANVTLEDRNSSDRDSHSCNTALTLSAQAIISSMTQQMES